MSDIYRETLRRIPDDVILSMATRPIELNNAYECVCGWGARELRAYWEGVPVEDSVGLFVTSYLAEKLGDDEDGWGRINGAYGDNADALELAFVERVLECVP